MIHPKDISYLVNFYSNSLKPNWTFEPMETDMRNLQVLGATKAYNLLMKEGLALLADEVGMGKTIQALAVCAALWNQNPNAKILIIAPREEIARNWQREYQTFVHHHYRFNDDIVKSAIGNDPIHQMVYCPNLYSLVHEIKQGWGKLFLGKISSFSSLMAGDKTIERLGKLGINQNKKLNELKGKSARKLEFNNEIISLLRREILQKAEPGEPYFDLVIIDEAHYLRNIDGDSLRVNSAKIYFGNSSQSNGRPITSKTLLLTATPNHSSSEDIKSIVSYFSDKYVDLNYKQLLDLLCIRRLRRLSEKAKSKYNYRKEVAAPSDFKNDPLSEMFFGLYQHELAREIHKGNVGRRGLTGVAGIIKYLEGVEFLRTEKEEDSITDDNTDKSLKTNDYTEGKDAQILLELSRKFDELFHASPSHPKYKKLVLDLNERHFDEKAVVFVRRIPSVKEISKRVLEHYDNTYWRILRAGLFSSLELKNVTRRSFKNISVINESNEEKKQIEQEVSFHELENQNIPSSRILNLFKTIKNDPIPHTPASYFRQKFNRSKPGIFSMFFSPGQDYYEQPYEGLLSYKYHTANERLENYFNSALIYRVRLLNDSNKEKLILSSLLNKQPIEGSADQKQEKIQTFLTIFWEVLKLNDKCTEELKSKVLKTYADFTIIEKEAFSCFIEKGTLLASEAIVHFYNEYLKLQKDYDEKPLQLYNRFCDSVKELLPSIRLFHQIIDSILQFRVIYTKVFSINSEEALLEENWDNFTNAQPVYPYNADNSNQKVLKSFNTPFYPDILVATSVLQEGVNLQYFCNTVYHYGMAWTPGDNEQRIGRIDRMFGKIERMLDENSDATLDIYYPYLKDTIDEDSLGRFVKRKYKEETMIDMGRYMEDSNIYSLEENEIEGWSRFLRQPDNITIQDPFPANPPTFNLNNKLERTPRSIDSEKYYHSIVNAIKGLHLHDMEVFVLGSGVNKTVLADPQLRNTRKQPVLVDIILDEIGTGYLGRPVYTIRMRTPLAPFSQLRKLKGVFYNNIIIQRSYLPGIKLCVDPSQTSGSNWAIYMLTELPLFMESLQSNPLSIEEIQTSFINLINCADITEKIIFERDLKKEDLNFPIFYNQHTSPYEFRKAEKTLIKNNWKQIGDYYILQQDSILNPNLEIEKQSFIANHKNRYAKAFLKDSVIKYEVSYLVCDAHVKELDLLEKHLSVVHNSENSI